MTMMMMVMMVKGPSRKHGIVVAVGYTAGAERDEAHAFYKRSRRIIKLLAVHGIPDEEHVRKM